MPLQPANVAAALATSSGVAWLCLLTITAAGQPPLRVVNNSVSITSRGNVYEPYPFAVVLPQDDSESLPQVKLEISNIDRAITEYVRAQLLPPAIEVELVTSAYPDTVEKSLSFLKLTSVTYDAMVLSGTLHVDNFLGQRFPAEAYTPAQFPGLFR
jgi:hypothetical protein